METFISGRTGLVKLNIVKSDPVKKREVSSSTRARGSGCGMAWPPLLGGLVTILQRGTSGLLPAVSLLVAPGLVEGLHAEGAVVRPVALPACLDLVLALVLSSAAGPLATHRLGGGHIILERHFLLLEWNCSLRKR